MDGRVLGRGDSGLGSQAEGLGFIPGQLTDGTGGKGSGDFFLSY